MNISVHCRFDAGVSQQLLQDFRRNAALNGACCVGVPQCVHTEMLDAGFIAQLVQMCVVGTVFDRLPCAKVDKHQLPHKEAGASAGTAVCIL